jgi:hypothetical protein
MAPPERAKTGDPRPAHDARGSPPPASKLKLANGVGARLRSIHDGPRGLLTFAEEEIGGPPMYAFARVCFLVCTPVLYQVIRTRTRFFEHIYPYRDPVHAHLHAVFLLDCHDS